MKRRTTPRFLALLLVFSMLLSLSAFAKGEEETPDPPDTVTVTDMAVSLPETLSPRLGEAPPTLTAEVAFLTDPEDGELPAGEEPGVTWSWSSDDTSVVTVDGHGATVQLALLKTGANVTVTAEATATIGGTQVKRTAQCVVTVFPAATTSIELRPTAVTVDKDKTANVTALLDPAGASLADIQWSMSAESIATFAKTETDGTVRITGASPGETTLTATSDGKSATCSVTVNGLTLDKTTLSLTAGSSGELKATPYGDIGAFAWRSENDNVATVSGGKVTAVEEGTTRIIVSVGSYQASCTVTVKANTAGVITDSASAGQPVSFAGLESDINSQSRSVLGSSLSYVTNLSVPTDQGILYYGYVSVDDTGAGVGGMEKYYYGSTGKGERSLSNVTFVAKSDFSGTAVISYTGYDSSNRFFNGTIRITVEETSDVVYSTGVNTPVTFRASDFSAICRNQNGRDMSFVSFTLPASKYGTLYYNYVSSGQLGNTVESNTNYNRSKSPYLDNVAFVPAEGYTGTVRIPYSGEDSSGSRFSGRVTIYVSGGGSSTGGKGDIKYRTAKGERVEFKVSDFNSLCKDQTGDSMDYVRFDLPSSSQGTLYYNYTSSGNYDYRLDSSEYCYRNSSPYLSRVSFVPKSGYSGTVEIDFTGYSDDGDRFKGTVSITVGSGSSSSGDLTYRTDEGEPVDFAASDFNDYCKNEQGVNLDYVRFDLPSSSRGTLYYDYVDGGDYDSKVTNSTRYYRDGSPYLSRVTFVPKSGYTGTVNISFTGYDRDGGRFTGTVEVIVGGGSSGTGTVTYKGTAGRAVTFSASDFNDVCKDVQGKALDYVRFDLPASGDGVLYYNYTGGGSYDSKVSSSTAYYRTGSSRQLSKVAFVPAGGIGGGTVKIDFTGYDVDGGKFNGVVKITVGAAAAKLQYTIKSFESLVMDASDFNNVCKDVTDGALDYVRFTLPAASQGVLYYDYNSDGGRVSASTSYYRGSGGKQLGRVSFVPVEGYSGTVEITYTGWNTSGESYTGTVRVEVVTPTARVIRYTTDAMPVVLSSGDFAGVCSDLTGKSLDYVQFSLPDSNAGRLYYDYTGPNSYGAQVRSGVSYYRSGSPELGRVSFVPRAGYQGAVLLTYTGTDSAGGTYQGSVEITINGGGASAGFRDMANYSWAAASVDYLYQNGIVTGISDMEFGPGQLITRGDFMLMLCRAFNLNTGSTDNFSDVPEDSYYAWATATAKELGIALGNGSGRFFPAGAVTRQDAMVFLQNAMRNAGWSLPDGSISRLSGYPDSGAVSGYAAGAMSAMVELGIIRGTGDGRLDPGGSLTRAELAVILHRAMTL